MVDSETGMPAFRPTVWLTGMRRAKHRAANTLHADLQAVKLLYDWADDVGLDLEQRILAGVSLTQAEIMALVQTAGKRRHLDNIVDIATAGSSQGKKRQTALAIAVTRQTASNRLRTAAEYLTWLWREGCSNTSPERLADRIAAGDMMIKQIQAMAPTASVRNALGRREGPSADVIVLLRQAIDPDSPDNPWTDAGVRRRNHLIVTMLIGLGLRRGELLNLRIEHIDFQRSTLTVIRSADDPSDPRRHQPLAKTRDRILPLNEGLMRVLEAYVLDIRRKIPKANRHTFLIVAHDTGRPLGLTSVNKLFDTLRHKVPSMPANLTPHALRHAWNDAFSRLMEERGISSEREEQMRSELMGWSPTSGMAQTYTRRYAREAAHQASIEHQRQLVAKP